MMLKIKALSLLLLASCDSIWADMIITCDWNNPVADGSSQLLSAAISMEEDELFSVPALRMTGLDAEVLTFTKTRSTRKGNDQQSWTGIFDAGIGFVTLIQDGNGAIAGSLSTDSNAYSIAKIAATNSYQLRSTLWKDFPKTNSALVKEEPQEPTATSYHRSWNNRFQNIFSHFIETSDNSDEDTKQGDTNDNIVPLKIESRKRLTTPSGAVDQDGMGSIIPSVNDRFLRGENRTLQQINIVDVLVVVTNRAMCEFTGRQEGCDGSDSSNNRNAIVQRISVLEEETNNAFSDTDIPVQLRVVDIIVLAPGFDGRTTVDTLETIRTNPTIREWRENVGADLVSFITGDGGRDCGIAYLNSFESANAYSCLDQYVFTHEIGHNFGAHHDRTTAPVSQHHPYAHGLRRDGQFRTIMAYPCPGGCPSIPYFSANGYQLTDGTPIGDADNDNARMIRETARSIANFQPTVIDNNGPTPNPPTTPTPPSPTPLLPPSNTPETTCPATTQCAPGDNLMNFSVLFFCYNSCVRQRAVNFRERFGWSCGGC